MTIVRSYIEAPARTPGHAPVPAAGIAVSVRILAAPAPWFDNSTGKVLGTSTTWTGQDGWWQIDIQPHTAFEHPELVYTEIVEHSNDPTHAVTHYAQVPTPDPHDPTKPVLLRDILVPPPPWEHGGVLPPPPPWVPIDRLARLRDVDADSVRNAKPGDYLVLLPTGKWGASRGPLPLSISWTPDPDDLLTVHITLAGFGGAGATLGWGDGSPEELVNSHDPVSHTYTQPGAFMVTATDVAWPAFTGTVKVTVKDHEPRVYLYTDGDDPWRVLLWIDEESDDTKYSIDWGDRSPLEQANGQNRIPPRPRVPHPYTATGRYHVTVTDLATKRSTSREVEVGEIGLLITYDAPDRPRITAVWLATGVPWEVEDNLYPPQSGIVPASGRVTVVAGQDVAPGHYWTELREIIAGQARRRSRRLYTHPTQWDWRLGVEMSWRDPSDPLGTQTVTVNPTLARNRCTVEWGDGSPSEVVDANRPIAHRYTLPAPDTGWRLRITETLVEDPRTWTRVLGEPQHVGTPVMSARTSGAVDLAVEGVDQEYNDDWYQIAWEPGSDPDPVGAVGRWYPANHVYLTEGVHTIRVDAPGMAEPITRDVEVKFYPAPTVTVTEALDGGGAPADPTRMTVQVSVDNSASGGPCTVRLGDGTAPRACAETETFTHTYAAAGSYDVIVASDADHTAKGRTVATVPFGGVRTLFYEITGVDGGYQVTVTVTEHDPAKTVRVQWESGGAWETVPPSNQLSHTYPPVPDMPTVTVAYSDGSESWPEAIDVPWTSP